jgi:hypothetical protein
MSEWASRFMEAVDTGQSLSWAYLSQGDIAEIAEELAETPYAAHLFGFLIAANASEATAAAVHLVATNRDPGVLTEIVRALVRSSNLDDVTIRKLHSLLLDQSGGVDLDPGTRSQALLGALCLSQRKPPLQRLLQAHLLEVKLDDDDIYLFHVARIVGIVITHVTDPDLRHLLDQLADVPGASDEALFALGLVAMGDALGEDDKTKASAAFRSSLELMRRAVAFSESRVDAELYSTCLEVLVAFQDGSMDGELSMITKSIERTAFEYSATLMPTSRPPDRSSWLGVSLQEGLLWSELATLLSRLDISLSRNAWLDAARVIETQLVRIYDASRSILLRSKSGGVEAILRPRLVTRMQDKLVQLSLLDEWITEKGNEITSQVAIELREQIRTAMDGHLNRNPTEAAPALAGVASLVAASGLSGEQKNEATSILEEAVRRLELERVSPIILEVFEAIHAKLQANKDYRDHVHARDFFVQILYATINFVASRDNLTPSAVNQIEYLFNLSKDAPPVEADLQRDYYGFLQATPLRELVQREVTGLAHGRADVYFSKEGEKTVAELKKTDRDLSIEGLAKSFGLQTSAYQRTNRTFCILMVLDLVDRGGGGDHLRASIDVVSVRPPMVTTEYSVVVFRVQGRKRSPSSL